MKQIVILFVMLLSLFLFVVGAMAMSSDQYRLDWYVPLSGSGAKTSSAHYQASLTVGQVAIGEASSTNFTTGLGYWFGLFREWLAHLPTVLKEFPR